MTDIHEPTDDQIRALRDGPEGLSDEILRDTCRVALQRGEPIRTHPLCRICGWRKGGADSWDGRACKCKLRTSAHHRCSTCAGMGRVPYDLGTQSCPSCDGSGLIDPAEVAIARARVAALLVGHGQAIGGPT